MVVPIEGFSAPSSKTKRYVGNGLVVRLKENHSTLYVIGNECKIKIEVNDGTLRIVGNSCRVRVLKGAGRIIYDGNEGRIRLGAEVDDENVTYNGNEGKILKEVPAGKNKSKADHKEEVLCGKTKRSSNNHTFNIVNKSHKHFSLSESMFSISIPSVIVVPNVTDGLIQIRVKK